MDIRLDRLRALPLVATVAICLSCSNGEYDFDSGDDAIETYRDFLQEVKEVKTSNTKDFTEKMCKWREVDDTVWNYLRTQQEYLKAHDHAGTVMDIHDSVRYQMIRLTETWRYGYEDVLNIKQQTSTYRDDKDLQKAVSEAELFFLAMDSVPVLEGDKGVILTRYKLFLIMTKSKTFQSEEDMKAFIRQEDLFFRSFLAHLSEMEGESLTEIIKNTEVVCRNIIIAAREGRIPAKDAMVYLSMRTVRRLLQNSVVCVDGMGNGALSKEQGNAYIWMIIQPFISIDQFAIATMTPREERMFKYVIGRLPKSVEFAKRFGVEQRALNYLLPQQLLKIYVMGM